MGPSVAAVENVVVALFPFLRVVVRLVVVLAVGFMGLPETSFGLLLQRIAGSVLVVRPSPPLVLDGLERSTSGSIIVTLVDLSSVLEVIVVKALVVELRVVVERLVVSVDLDVVLDVDVDVDADVDVDGDIDVDVDVRVGRPVVTFLAVILLT